MESSAIAINSTFTHKQKVTHIPGSLAGRMIKAIGFALLSLLLVTAGGTIGELIISPMKHLNSDTLTFLTMYLSFIGIWIVIIGYCLITRKNRKYLIKLGSSCEGNNLKNVLLIGLPCGIGLNLLVAFAAMLHGDISLSFIQFNPVWFLAFAISVIIQSGAEELSDRFFLYQKVRELFPECPLAPVLVNAFVFSALHLPNPGITPLAFANIVAAGVLYSLIIYYFDSFWAVVIAHASWNFCQNILLGLPNSGIVSAYSVFGLNANTAQNSFAYNTNFGIEGTILSTVLLAVACVVIAFVGRKKRAQDQFLVIMDTNNDL